MNIEETKNTVNTQLVDNGLKEDYKEPAVRHMLFHLCIAIDIYRHMTTAERFKAGYWYRNNSRIPTRSQASLKSEKRNERRKNPPCTPLIKKTAE